MFSGWVKKAVRTVGFRIALWHAATFIVGTVLVFALAFFLLRRAADEQTHDDIEFRLRQFSFEFERGGRDAVIALCNLRKGRAQKAYFVRLADKENFTTFLRDAEDWSEFQPHLFGKMEVPAGVAGVRWSDHAGAEGSVLRLGSERMKDGAILQVGKSLEARRELLTRFQWALSGIAALVIVVGVAGGALTAFRALRPVHRLTELVRSILDTGKFTARVPPRGTGDDIDELVECFNSMLVRIDGLITGMRDSLDNVAHDLRTPMTRLRNIAANAIEHDLEKPAAQDALAECLEESERVLTMLVTMMDIAEAETGVVKLDRQNVAVSRITGQVLDLYQHVADEKNIAVQVSVPTWLRVNGDAGRLLRALGNLMDNALKYTPEGGRVEIRARSESGGITIEFADTGEGIPAAEIERIWERLYRVDKSRSQRGLGLGLSFVKAIIEAHGGTVAVQSEAGRGSVFSVHLPG